MADFYAYMITPQSVTGDFVFSMTYDLSNFEGLTSWGVIPAFPLLTAGAGIGGQVQTAYPIRPYFKADGLGNVLPENNAFGSTSATTGDLFSIHRTGSLIRYYKNFHAFTVPVPLLESTYSSSESFRFYAEVVVSVGSAGIQPEWGSLQYRLPRAYKYTDSQQIADFGSLQSVGTIKTRVSQESAIVGVGDYTEANL